MYIYTLNPLLRSPAFSASLESMTEKLSHNFWHQIKS